MECPICHVKLMADEREKHNVIQARCIKCGREFIIKQGRVEQKKIKRVKRVIKKKGTIRGGSSGTDRIVKEQERIIKQHKQVQQQLEIMRKLHKMRTTQ